MHIILKVMMEVYTHEIKNYKELYMYETGLG